MATRLLLIHLQQLTYQPVSDYTFNQNLTVSNPNLWSPDSPYLYMVQTQVIVDGKVADTYKVNHGISLS